MSLAVFRALSTALYCVRFGFGSLDKKTIRGAYEAVLNNDLRFIATRSAHLAIKSIVSIDDIATIVSSIESFSNILEKSRDKTLIDSGVSPSELAKMPLWSYNSNKWANSAWSHLVGVLPKDEDWDVWFHWYRDVINGVSHPAVYDLTFTGCHRGNVFDIWSQGSAAANNWIKEHLPEGLEPDVIPDLRPATVEPILVDDILTIRKEPLNADLATADIAAALAALRSRFERLLGEIENANIDPRFPVILREFINRLPSDMPDAETVFDMGHELAALRGYEPIVVEEWPETLSPRYSAALLALDMTLKKFPKWREFMAGPEATITLAQAESISSISRVLSAAMQVEGASEHIDPIVPATLDALSNSAESIGGGIASMEQAGRALIAKDELESINNILKVEASLLAEEPNRADVVAIFQKEIKEAGDDVKRGAREAKSKMLQAFGGASIIGPVAVFVCVAANALGIPVFEWLLKNFNSQFGWLEPFLKYLNLI
jgi:hypothetical protein